MFIVNNFKILSAILLIYSSVSTAEQTPTKNDELKKKFDQSSSKLLTMDFSTKEERKKFLDELKNLQKIYDLAKENAIKEETPDFTPTPISKLTTTMAIELSFLEQLEDPVRSQFNRETCINAIASNSGSVEADATISAKVAKILTTNCKIK